jgi:flagellar hook assembly protein FlgD
LNSSDSTRIKIDAYTVFGSYQYSIDTLVPSGDSILNLGNQINAITSPYIKLKAVYKDEGAQTPTHLKNWHVLYSPLPEAAIDGVNLEYGVQSDDTLQEGQKGKFSIGIKNISSISMDSLLVNYYILDANQQKHYLNYPRQDSLRVNGTLMDTIEFDTKNIIGLNYLCMEVNPYIDASQTILDQPELTHINNVLQLPFVVEAEEINPILDVTFDGRRIMNEDIVSPTSEILITLKDENPYLLMNEDADTARFGIYLKYPDGNQIRIPFIDGQGNTVMQWTPATDQNKKFKIVFPTQLTQNGLYELLVQGTDKSGNLSGDLEYRITFKVVLESSITQLLNYPNPFSTSTKFVFTLTGSEIPDDFQIQIFTVTGKVIREIDEAELGPLFIGKNVTSFAWDGRDQFGDLVANGVYLYRVKAQIGGKDIKQLESTADDYFKNGFGKMYLIR